MVTVVPFLLEVEDWRYGFLDPLAVGEVVGELLLPLIWLAGANVLPKLDPGPVSAEGSRFRHWVDEDRCGL